MDWAIPHWPVGLTAGRPRLDRASLRRLLAIDTPADRTVLVGFGGMGFPLPAQLFDRWPGHQFLVTDPALAAAAANAALLPEGLRPLDGMPLCGRVLTKPGYSTFCEALSQGLGVHLVHREGFAEVIKHGAIRDAALLDALDPAAPRDTLAPLIARNIAIKAAIVAADEHEQTGQRALLNFGHTIAHAIENVAGYGRFLHGEAVSLGLAAALEISQSKAGLSAPEAARVRAKLAAFGLPLTLAADLSADDLLAAARRDKKFTGGRVRYVVTPRLGEAFVAEDVTEDDLRAALQTLRV